MSCVCLHVCTCACRYDDAEDNALDSVLKLVRHLDACADIRPTLKVLFGLEPVLQEYREVKEAILVPSLNRSDFLSAVMHRTILFLHVPENCSSRPCCKSSMYSCCRLPSGDITHDAIDRAAVKSSDLCHMGLQQ